MGGLKTLFAVLTIAAPLCGPVRADEDLLRTLATCTGRLSAEMEHHWLMGDRRADQTEAQRDALADVLEAMAPPEFGRTLLAWRVEAKMAQVSLLSRATFNSDNADAEWARRQAETLISHCVALVLS